MKNYIERDGCNTCKHSKSIYRWKLHCFASPPPMTLDEYLTANDLEYTSDENKKALEDARRAWMSNHIVSESGTCDQFVVEWGPERKV